MPDLYSTSSQESSPRSFGFRSHAALALLALLTVATHGFHPLAEDGGLYVAGVDLVLQPSLFPHDRAFVAAHLHYSIFAPLLANIVRLTHVPLSWLLFLCFVFTAWLYLVAIFRLARVCLSDDEDAALGAAMLAAAWFSLPVAGTSLLLMDPYVTARSFSTPLSLLALTFVLQAIATPDLEIATPKRITSLALAAAMLALAFAFHPLMAGYAAALCLFLFAFAIPSTRIRARATGGLVLSAILLCAALQHHAPSESTAYTATVVSRYYWFLSHWQWFELLGILGPVAILGVFLLRKPNSFRSPTRTLLRAAIVFTLLSVALCLLFARESQSVHAVARLQPMRVLLPVYAVMIALLGGAGTQWAAAARRRGSRIALPSLAVLIGSMFVIFFFVSRASFPRSAQVEFPWAPPRNPWSQAFLWIRDHTPPDAFIALDARYVNTEGEDAQNFRATALRSQVPDYSKDGGEAAITSQLAKSWMAGAAAQQNLSSLSDEQRAVRLKAFPVTWMVLHSNAVTANQCPFDNGTVKVCELRR